MRSLSLRSSSSLTRASRMLLRSRNRGVERFEWLFATSQCNGSPELNNHPPSSTSAFPDRLCSRRTCDAMTNKRVDGCFPIAPCLNFAQYLLADSEPVAARAGDAQTVVLIAGALYLTTEASVASGLSLLLSIVCSNS
ncbi:hypothetical protein KC349_g84 [Hortaea werneckii]|nr:hypothetical protein KC349_g84 [Hortaea werneckii]